MMNYNPMELMICCAARLLENGSTVAVGTGAPCAAAMLAQLTAIANIVSKTSVFVPGTFSPRSSPRNELCGSQ